MQSLPQLPKHASPRCGRDPAQEHAHAFLYRDAHGADRRRVKHMRARLRQGLRHEPRVLQLALMHRRLPRRATQRSELRRVERGAGCPQAREDLFKRIIIPVRRCKGREGASTDLLVQRDLAVEMLFGESLEIFDFLRVICLHLRHSRVQYGLAARGNLLVLLCDCIYHLILLIVGRESYLAVSYRFMISGQRRPMRIDDWLGEIQIRNIAIYSEIE